MSACHFSRLDDRRTVFIDAARNLFVTRGYAATSLGDIVAESGGSLATLYKLFNNKEGLFRAVLVQHMQSGAEVIDSIAASQQEFEPALYLIGDRLHAMLLEPTKMAMFRIVIARSMEDPDFARSFYEETIEQTHGAIERFLSDWRDKGVTLSREPGELATIFLSLIIYDFQLEAISRAPMLAHRTDTLSDRVEFFIRGAVL